VTESSNYLAENAATRERLQSVASRLSDADLARPVGESWTVASTFVHLAFWDWCRLALLQRWELLGVEAAQFVPDDVNAGVQALAMAIPARETIQLAMKAAQAVDHEIEMLPAELAAAIEASGNTRVLRRSIHRNLHLDDIEKALATHA
jgi:DinB superfamily